VSGARAAAARKTDPCYGEKNMNTRAARSIAILIVSLAAPQVMCSSNGSKGGSGAAAGMGSAGVGSPPAGLSCSGILDCLDTCADTDAACTDACEAKGTAGARSLYLALSSCDSAANCADYACLETKCGPELQACNGAPGPSGSGGISGSAGAGDPSSGGAGATTAAGSLSCAEILTCLGQCPNGDTACTNGCAAGGTVAAQSSYSAILQCLEAASCADSACGQSHCGPQLAACSGPGGGGGGAGGQINGGAGAAGSDSGGAGGPGENAPVIATLTAYDLVHAYEGNSVGADQSYKGQRVRVTGIVNTIKAEGNQIYVQFRETIASFGFVRAYFSQAYGQQLGAIAVNAQITVDGTVRGYDGVSAVYLDRCSFP
jgi:hypothetical protein